MRFPDTKSARSLTDYGWVLIPVLAIGVGVYWLVANHRAPTEEETRARQTYSEAAAQLRYAAKDADSVKFREVRASADGWRVCGEFNGKNSFGAYGGFKLFAYSPLATPKLAVEDDADFSVTVTERCADLSATLAR
jgi:hypothetical protein